MYRAEYCNESVSFLSVHKHISHEPHIQIFYTFCLWPVCAILCLRGIKVTPKLRVLPTGNLSQTLATAINKQQRSAWCWQQLATTTDRGRKQLTTIVRCWSHSASSTVYSAMVDSADSSRSSGQDNNVPCSSCCEWNAQLQFSGGPWWMHCILNIIQWLQIQENYRRLTQAHLFEDWREEFSSAADEPRNALSHGQRVVNKCERSV